MQPGPRRRGHFGIHIWVRARRNWLTKAERRRVVSGGRPEKTSDNWPISQLYSKPRRFGGPLAVRSENATLPSELSISFFGAAGTLDGRPRSSRFLESTRTLREPISSASKTDGELAD